MMGLCYDLKDVWFRYTQQWILQDFNVQVSDGEILGVIGPNGSGKTSLLKLMAGLLHAQRGMATLHGRDVRTLQPPDMARLVAIVPQNSHILFPFTVGELVLMGRFVHQRGWGWESAEDLRVAGRALATMDLHDAAHRTVQELSGGERQRAVIARALAQEAPILLLDEPTAFLDIKHQLEIYATLRMLNHERGVTVIVVSHDLNLASQYCHKLLLLNDGRPFMVGTPEEVLTEDHLKTVYGCQVLVDRHPVGGTPRITLPAIEPDNRRRFGRDVSPAEAIASPGYKANDSPREVPVRDGRQR
jgi:iron complex transport system ATP-binding protein